MVDMAASDELPRGFNLTTGLVSPTSQVQITLPAITGISRVITDVWCRITGASTSVEQQYTLAIGPLVYRFIHLPAGIQTDEVEWSGKLLFPLGASVLVQISNQPLQTGNFAVLTVQGYDV